MFIELTDHLICPSGHEEETLVLLPEAMEGRRVVRGDLGCPVCGRVVRVMEGVVEFEAAPPPSRPTGLVPEAVHAFLGLGGPGGFVALAGAVAGLADGLAALLPGVGLVLVNPPAGTPDRLPASVVRASRLPLRAGSMRGIALGPELAARADWVEAAGRAVLPGLRIVAEGGEPPVSVELLAQSAECWVGRRPARQLRS
ncbi:MAG TPA: hypothetical protein VI383_04305 [Gemmatimonadales bacterium]|nr:hypothetical protein [Gemmatimonadales bacterium]